MTKEKKKKIVTDSDAWLNQFNKTAHLQIREEWCHKTKCLSKIVQLSENLINKKDVYWR